ELFSAYYDQVILKNPEKCGWITKIMQCAASRYANLLPPGQADPTDPGNDKSYRMRVGMEMLEEAMSELMENLAERSFSPVANQRTEHMLGQKAGPGITGAPQHNKESGWFNYYGEKWSNPYFKRAADTPMPEYLRDLTLWVMQHGCEKPPGGVGTHGNWTEWFKNARR